VWLGVDCSSRTSLLPPSIATPVAGPATLELDERWGQAAYHLPPHQLAELERSIANGRKYRAAKEIVARADRILGDAEEEKDEDSKKKPEMVTSLRNRRLLFEAQAAARKLELARLAEAQKRDDDALKPDASAAGDEEKPADPYASKRRRNLEPPNWMSFGAF
jgi:hypothetical protein